jgi:hypothetical protein
MHIGGLVAGGGGAITVDLATITAARTRSSTLMTQLDLLKRTHVVVILGLIALVVSGVLLFAADVDTFISSRIFWMKMGLMVALLANGVLLIRSERNATHAGARVDAAPFHRDPEPALWFLITLAGYASQLSDRVEKAEKDAFQSSPARRRVPWGHASRVSAVDSCWRGDCAPQIVVKDASALPVPDGGHPERRGTSVSDSGR